MAFIGNYIASSVGGYIDGMVSGVVATAGTWAGDTVGGVGNTINGVGSGIERSIRQYGDGTKDYGNAIKDWSGAPGTRGTTAQNPLGLPGTPSGGKAAISSSPFKNQTGSTTNAKMNRSKAGSVTQERSLTTTSKITSKPGGSKVAAVKKTGPAAPAKKVVPVNKAAPSAAKKPQPVAGAKKPVSAVSNKKASTGVTMPNAKQASNPLGLSGL